MASAISGNWLQCKFSGSIPVLLNRKLFWSEPTTLCFNKFSRWSWCTLKFENIGLEQKKSLLSFESQSSLSWVSRKTRALKTRFHWVNKFLNRKAHLCISSESLTLWKQNFTKAIVQRTRGYDIGEPFADRKGSGEHKVLVYPRGREEREIQRHKWPYISPSWGKCLWKWGEEKKQE